MGNPFATIQNLLCNTSINEDEKQQLLVQLKNLEKGFNLNEFKIQRLETMRQTLTVMLEESVEELSKKSSLLEETNATLSKTLEELKDHAAAIEIQKQQLVEEKTRSEKLLLDILPQEIVEELKKYGRSYARKYDSVTVLMADIKNFSTIAETLKPDELIMHLDDYFRGFDNIIEKYGIEKIKTIGDAYMCVSGLFKNTPDHALNMVLAAADMQKFIESISTSKQIQGMPAFEFRIGIHSGSVVAGVIGVKKFAYDIWGDTVNMAARMEQNGAPGKINISASTYELIKNHFACINRGFISLKNGREMEMFFIEQLH